MPLHRARLRLAVLFGLLLGALAATPTPAHADEALTLHGPPTRLVAPALGVDADVRRFGLTPAGEMAVPSVGHLVAWYDFSAASGAPGNAVLAGHRDWQGRRGVFYALSALAPGDDVWLQDADRHWYLYRVLWNDSYVDATAPLDTIIGPTFGRILTLITCSGVFDRAAGQYVERQVVRAAYVTTVPAAASE